MRYYNHPRLAYPIVKVVSEYQNRKCTRYDVDDMKYQYSNSPDYFIRFDKHTYARTFRESMRIGCYHVVRPDVFGNRIQPSQMAYACTLTLEKHANRLVNPSSRMHSRRVIAP